MEPNDQQHQEIRRILALTQQTNANLPEVCLDALQSFHRKYPSTGLDALKYNSSGDTILHCAARHGNIPTCTYLLHHFSVECRNKDNKTPLHEAAQAGHLEVAKLLLSAGAQVDALKKADWTPLMLVCTKLQVQGTHSLEERHALAALLLANGAKVNFQNKDGWTALHLATREGDTILLFQHGAEVSKRTRNGNTTLHIAALHQHSNAFRLLLKMLQESAVLKCQNNQGNYPIHETVLSKSLAMFKLVVDYYKHLDINIQQLQNNSGFNVLHLAAFIGCDDMINFCVKECDCDINYRTNDGQNCLHLSAQNEMWTVFELCLDLGADSTALDKFGRTPHDYRFSTK